MIDFDPAVIDGLQARGIPCLYGDAADNELLDEFDLKKVSMLVSTVPDFETNLFLLNKLRRRNKQALFISMSQSPDEAMLLYRGGADYVILPHYLGGNYAALVLDKYGFDASRLEQEKEKHIKHLEKRLNLAPARAVSGL